MLPCGLAVRDQTIGNNRSGVLYAIVSFVYIIAILLFQLNVDKKLVQFLIGTDSCGCVILTAVLYIINIDTCIKRLVVITENIKTVFRTIWAAT